MSKFKDAVNVAAMNGEYESAANKYKDKKFKKNLKKIEDQYLNNLRNSKLLPDNLSDSTYSTAYSLAYNIVGESPSTSNVNAYLEAYELISNFISEIRWLNE